VEVGGFELESTPRVRPIASPTLPDVIPHVRHKYCRQAVLAEPVVAVSLYDLFHLTTGEPLVKTRAELAARFRISDAAIVVATGVEKDFKVEAWWALSNRPRLLETLRALEIGLITTPNFSLFTNIPRPDNLHAMKRIALCWTELTAAGIPAALHLNARTDFDFLQWTRFVTARPEIAVVAFEFGTGAGYPDRIDWHVDQLCALARSVDRPLTLVLRGGTHALAKLRAAFDRVILVETQAFSRAIKRRRATISESGRLRWPKSPTPKGHPIDDLLAHNIATVRIALRHPSAPLPVGLRSPQRAIRRPTTDANRQANQTSFMSQLDAALQTRVLPANGQRVIAAAKS
jgi:hypothetical protein